MAALRWRRPVKPSESVTGTHSIGSASACSRIAPAYGGRPARVRPRGSGTVELAPATRRPRPSAAQTGHTSPVTDPATPADSSRAGENARALTIVIGADTFDPHVNGAARF